MVVAVDESGKERDAGEIDYLSVGTEGYGVSRSDRVDAPVVADEDGAAWNGGHSGAIYKVGAHQ